MPSFALAAIGRDRPGIVSTVAQVLYEQGCNVEDSSMTLLRGNFAIMLVLSAPDDVAASSLEAALTTACHSLGLTVSVLPVDDTPEAVQPSHILTVYGADRPGILFRVTEALANNGVNITDLNSRLVGQATPVYAIMLELSVPDDASELDRILHDVATDVSVELSLRRLDTDIL